MGLDNQFLRHKPRPINHWPDDVEDLLDQNHNRHVTDDAVRDQSAQFGRVRPRPPIIPTAQQKPQPEAAQSNAAKAMRSARRPIAAWLWAAIGFGMGVAFWHFIGFWGFVSDVVHPPTKTAYTTEAAPLPALGQQKDIVFPARGTRAHAASKPPALPSGDR